MLMYTQFPGPPQLPVLSDRGHERVSKPDQRIFFPIRRPFVYPSPAFQWRRALPSASYNGHAEDCVSDLPVGRPLAWVRFKK